MSPLDATYLGIPGYIIFWLLTIVALGFFTFRISHLIRYMLLGRKEKGFSHLLRRGLATAVTALGQWCQLKGISLKDRAGIGHIVFAWGFSVFVVFYGVFIIVGAGFGLSEPLEQSGFFFYYTWIMDIIAPAIILAALWAIVRRYIIQPPRLKGEQSLEAMVILITVLLHPLTHLFKIATGIALNHPPAGLGAALPPLSSWLASLFNNLSPDSVQAANAAFFWGHWLIVLFVLVFIAYSRYLHMVASLFNIFFRSPPPKGTLRRIDLEAAETLGIAKITDLTWKQVLDLYACVVCGRCQDVCPATASGKRLNPKELIQSLKRHLLKSGPELLRNRGDSPTQMLPGNVIHQDEIWECTTCRACDEVCPLYVEHIDKLVGLRRNLVMEQAAIPPSAEQTLRSIEARGHPWRGAAASRADWAGGLNIKTIAEDGNVELLLWVGCSGALEERSIRVTRSVARILKQAGINFGVLAAEESCCGEPARRLGNEYLFQEQTERNIKMLHGYGIKKILTACPHCYNTIKNEYPDFGGDFEVMHHTQLIADLLKDGRLSTRITNDIITYHDPCYLGRYNDTYKPPRAILKKITGTSLAEMKDHGKRSLCCGGGGGRMWLEESTGHRISELRIEQVAKTGARTVATACPFCLQMLDDAIKARGYQDTLKAMDIAELVAEAIETQP